MLHRAVIDHAGTGDTVYTEPCGPWENEEAAMLELTEELVPKEDGK